jgi:hypothetical protein
VTGLRERLLRVLRRPVSDDRPLWVGRVEPVDAPATPTRSLFGRSKPEPADSVW